MIAPHRWGDYTLAERYLGWTPWRRRRREIVARIEAAEGPRAAWNYALHRHWFPEADEVEPRMLDQQLREIRAAFDRAATDAKTAAS